MSKTLRRRYRDLGPRGFARWVLQKRLGKGILRQLDKVIEKSSQTASSPVFNADEFEWTGLLEERTPAIQKELEFILAQREKLPVLSDIQPDQDRIASDHWKVFPLRAFNLRAKKNCERVPETARVLDEIPRVTTAWISILGPHAHIPRHSGYTRGILRCHLGLVVPESNERCEMEVGDTRVRWEVGKCVIFDDRCKHEVWNDTDEERVLLLLDVERPMSWPGHLALQMQHAILRFSPFLRDARRNLQAWEERVYQS